MKEGCLERKEGKNKQTYELVWLSSALFSASQFKKIKYCQEVFALYFGLDYFSHFICGEEKPVIALTDKKSLISFFSQNQVIQIYGTSWLE